MLATILKPFYCAQQRHTVVALEAGAVVEIDDDLVDGLIAEGFIAEAPAEAVAASFGDVAIPEDFTTLPWQKLQTIGRALGLARSANKTDTLAAIQTELARRAAPPAE